MGVNVLNPEDIAVFLRGFAQEGGDPRVGDYMALALNKAFLSEESFFTPVSTYPETPPPWLTPEKFRADNFVAFDSERITSQTLGRLRHVQDWIAGALQDGDAWISDVNEKGYPKKLSQISSLGDADRKVDKEMRRKTNILRSRFAGAASSFEADEAAGHIKTIQILDSGSRIVQLLTAHALDGETVQLGHCIGNGGYDTNVAQTDQYQYYSLRDPLNQAHATLEVEGGILKQCKGKENAPPIEKYFTPLQVFIKQNQWRLEEASRYTGLLYQEGEYYAINNLPEDFHYQGAINLAESKWFKGFHAGGDVNLERCSALTHLPEGFHAGGHVDLWGCSALTHLPEGFHAGGDVDLWDCNALTHLPEGFHAGGDVYLHGCNALTHLPEGFHAGGDVNLWGCSALTHLPEGFHAGGDVNLLGCNALTHLPEDLKIEGNIYWGREVFSNLEDFRTAFEKEHPPSPIEPSSSVSMAPPALCP